MRGGRPSTPTAAKGGGAMPFEFSVSDFIPARAQDIYDAWLSSNGHEKITGGQKAQISAQEGAAFTVWNGYITGRNLTLEPGRRIVQSWRTTKFTAADEATLQARTVRSCPMRGGALGGIRAPGLQIQSLIFTTRRRPIYRARGQLQVRTPPAYRTAQIRTAT